MKRLTIYTILAFFLFSSFYVEEKKETVLSLKKFEDEVLLHINKYRTKKRLKSLKNNVYMSNLAREHSQRMATKKARFGHGGFNKRYDKVTKNTGANSMSENVIYGYNTPEEAVKGWIASHGHHQNIIGNYNISGVGAYKAKNGNIYVTQLFANVKK